jgi:hypothetical protein
MAFRLHSTSSRSIEVEENAGREGRLPSSFVTLFPLETTRLENLVLSLKKLECSKLGVNRRSRPGDFRSLNRNLNVDCSSYCVRHLVIKAECFDS